MTKYVHTDSYGDITGYTTSAPSGIEVAAASLALVSTALSSL